MAVGVSFACIGLLGFGVISFGCWMGWAVVCLDSGGVCGVIVCVFCLWFCGLFWSGLMVLGVF